MADSHARDDRERRLRQAAEFNGRPVLTLLCMGAMMAFGVVPIVLAVRMAVSARHWVETPIEVVDAGLHRSHAGVACFAVAPVWPMYLAARALVARGRLRRRGIEPAS